MQDIKAYKPETNSIGSGQVLHCAYPADKAKIVVREMTENLSLELIRKKILTDHIILTIGYDKDNIGYDGPVKEDMYGRKIPKHAHGTQRMEEHTNSQTALTAAMMNLYDRIVNKKLSIRRLTITFGNIIPEEKKAFHQMNISEKEKKLQEAILKIQDRYGKNSILKAANLQEGSTVRERNEQIGGHHA